MATKSETDTNADEDNNLSESESKQNNVATDDSPLTRLEKIKMILSSYWRGIVCIVTPIILIPLLLSFPTEKHQWCAYALVLMAIYWVTECIPLPVTSFLPILIFPLTGVMSTTACCSCYMNDTVMMFLGSMIMAYAVEQSGLHKRLALCAIRAIGYSHYRLLFAMCFITMFISMWITNTAASTLMVPINFAVLKVFEDQNLLTIYDVNSNGERVASDITTCYFCAATFSATIGGIGTLVGTATNFVFKGLFAKSFPNAPEYLSFPKFSAFAIPYMLLMEAAMYIYLIIVYFGFLRPKSGAAQKSKLTLSGIEAAKKAVNEDYKGLGSITYWEISVILLFTLAISLFFCRSPQIFEGWGDQIISYFGLKNKKYVQDSSTAMLVVFLMFLLPSTLDFIYNCKAKGGDSGFWFPEVLSGTVLLWAERLTWWLYQVDEYGDFPKSIPSVLSWEKMNVVMPYSFMFLLGGGFALSEAAKEDYTDLNGRIGIMLRNFRYLSNGTILLLIIIFTVFITNFASNVAVCNVIAPIVMQLGKEIHQNPLWYNIAAGYSASYAFCLPVGTPGNLIVQSVANIPTAKMIKAGAGPTITTIVLTWICIYFWAPVIWPDLHTVPDWIQDTRTRYIY